MKQAKVTREGSKETNSCKDVPCLIWIRFGQMVIMYLLELLIFHHGKWLLSQRTSRALENETQWMGFSQGDTLVPTDHLVVPIVVVTE